MDFFNLLSQKYKLTLNDQQKAAVSFINGPALVLAGPGSGKTAVITARTAFLCLEVGVNPRNILTMTFSRASTFDMKSRFDRLFTEAVNQKVRFSTIHSFCHNVLRDYEEKRGQKFRFIESENEEVRKDYILRDIYLKINKTKVNDEELEMLTSEIGLVKNRMIKDIDEFATDAGTKNFSEIFLAYENFKKENYFIDYDDMLTHTYSILKKCPDILGKYKRIYKYIQVDEGQDLSKIQFEILNLLVDSSNQNLFIVADDDQSIYAFRGAQPEHILNIKTRYDGCQIFKLETNYRSSKNIVELSSHFIKTNKRRFDKNHQTLNAEISDPSIINVENESEQIKFLLREISLVQKDTPKTSIAIIFRNNLSSISIADVLERKGFSYKIRKSNLHFFKHWVVLDVLAMLRFSLNQTDIEPFERIYFKIKRYISKAMLEFASNTYYKESFINAILEYPNLQPFQIRKLTDLKSEFKKLSLMNPTQAIEFITTNFNYEEYMQDYCDKTRASYDYVCNIFGILKLIAIHCESIEEFIDRIDELSEMLKDKEMATKKAKITLTTMHSSKGLEFDRVYMIDLTNDEIPSVDIKDVKYISLVEEERRLFYVGMTRARNLLTLIYPKFRGGVPQQQSAFLKEVAACLHIEEKPSNGEVCEGVILCHKTFGSGVVESVERIGENVFIKVSFGGIIKTLDYTVCKQNKLISIEE